MEIKTIVNSLVDLFFPMRCIHCDEVIPSNETLCVSCVAELPFTHWDLHQNNKIYQQIHQYCNVDNAYSLLHFTKHNVTQSILHEMKYKNRPELGLLIADLVTIDLSEIDYIIPVPIHPKRLKERGYNQVHFFASQLAKNHRINYDKEILARSKFNSSQVDKNKEDRIKSLSNSFQLTSHPNDGHYLIVDDLLTTGATLSQAVLPFNQHPNVNVSVLTIGCA